MPGHITKDQANHLMHMDPASCITKDQANQLKHSVDAPSRITRDQASQLTYTGESWLQVALKEFCSAAAPVRSLISLKFLYVLILFLGASF